MKTKYPETYYSFKFIPRQVALVSGQVSAIGSSIVATGPTVNAAQTETETKIQHFVVLGHSEFHAGRYLPALDYYLQAWNLIPKSLWFQVPDVRIVTLLDAMLKVDLNDALIEKSSLALQKIKYGLPDGPLPPVVTDPPPEIQAVMKELNAPQINKPELHLERGVQMLEQGLLKQAAKEFKIGMEGAGGRDKDLLLRAKTGLAAIELRSGNYSNAVQQFGKLKNEAIETGNKTTIASMDHNIGVAHTLDGNDAEAGKYFAQSASQIDTALDWKVTHTTNPGIQSVERPVGIQGLSMVLDIGTGWKAIPTTPAAELTDSFVCYQGNEAVMLDLNADLASEIENKLLKPRISANTLDKLGIHFEILPQFISYFSHVGGFVLPMALGDCYAALGDYDKAISYYTKVRDYKYLNLAIERPVVWLRMAKAYLRKGIRQYRNRDNAGAQVSFEKIVKIVNGNLQMSGPLYSGTFSAFKTPHKNFLKSTDKIGFSSISYERRIILLNAFSTLNQILTGFNYLGLPENIVPIHSWQYLQNLARYFAKQAIQAERAYISFRDGAEKEEMTRLILEQSVQAQQAAVKVEERRVNASVEQRKVAVLGAQVADVRLDNAQDRKADFESTSAELAVLEEINGWATGPMDKANIDGAWAEVLGMDPGTYDTYQVVRRVAALRAQISNAFELRDKQRQIDELTASKAVADAQVGVADKMIAMAYAQLELAQLRVAHSDEQLAAFEDQEFTPELWHALADAQREISDNYLDQAINVAFLMERAFEFEYDLEVNRIRFDYAKSELQGLLSADFLLQDIDQFSYDRVLQTEKQLPIKATISLADRYPYQFFNEFMRNGKIEFETLLEDFDFAQPGAHVRKLRRLEVVVEGSIGREGLRGILSNSGISRFRDRNGDVKVRQQKPEIQLLSLYDMRRDGFVFTLEDSVLELFENSGVASGWTLEIPPNSNDLNYGAISNIHVTYYYDAFYSKSIEHRVRAELAAAALYEHQLGFRLSAHFPDEFFALQDSGSVGLNLDNGYLPRNHTQSTIKECRIVIQTETGISAQNIVVSVTAQTQGITLDQTTDVNGMIATGSGTAAMNTLRGAALQDTWTVFFDPAKNAAAIAAGFSWDKVTDIYQFVEYQYTPRGHHIISDDFTADPMARFDVVDDAAAVNSAPSQWSHDTSGFIQQTANIHGGPSGSNSTSVNRPGTCLVRKENAHWVSSRDICLRATVQSMDDDGIGLVFRYQDPDNFYFFLMDSQRGVMRLGKKIAGTFIELNEAAANTTVAPYTPGTNYNVAVAAVDDAMTVYIDDKQVLVGRDADLLLPGRVGLYSWGNTGARFHRLELETIWGEV